MASLKFFFICSTYIAIFLTPISCEDYQNFIDCYLSFECGLLQNLTYPFWNTNGSRPEQCGLKPFSLTCRNDDEYPLMYINGTEFLVKNIDSSSHIITLARSKSINESCPMDITLDGIFLNYSSAVNNLTLFYTCKTSPVPPPLSSNESSFSCGVGGESGYYSALSTTSVNEMECEMESKVLISAEAIEQLADGNLSLGDALMKELDLDYKAFDVMCDACEKSDGICGSDYTRSSQSPFTCFCRDGPHLRCDDGGGGETKNIIKIVSTVVPAILIISICIWVFLRARKSRKNINDDDVNEITSVEYLQYDFNTINVATNNFSHANKLGQGGFGAVYKGRLLNGQEVAVKRLAKNSGQGDLEFKNEAVLVAKLQHKNLVTLLGFCFEGVERLLIYEFVPNTSLDHFIFDPIKRKNLDWGKRYKIIEGIARGLLYLHEDSRIKIIHRDLKASNVLLDAEMSPKISDFGMARLFAIDQTEGATNRIVGTYGYMAPEYARYGQFSVKSDVFSFGVMVLEIVTGRKSYSLRNNGSGNEDLLSFAWRNWRDGIATSIVDPTILSVSSSELLRCIHIGLLCVQESVANRPTMASVARMLNNYSLSLPLPSQPTFIMCIGTEVCPRMSKSKKRKIDDAPLSTNKASITELYPR